MTSARRKLGDRVRQLRKKADLSQEELGFRSGLHRTYIGQIERAETNVTLDNIHKIAKALRVNLQDLLS